jgi:hypothetical protein
MQTTQRGYAAMAADISQGVGNGVVASELVRSAVGDVQYTEQFRTQLSLNLARADNERIQNEIDRVPTLAEVASDHFTIFGRLGIPITAWAGTAFTAMGRDYTMGTATAAERSVITPPEFAQLTLNDIGDALGRLTKTALGTVSWGTISNVNSWIAYSVLKGLQQEFDNRLQQEIWQGILRWLKLTENANGTYQVTRVDASDGLEGEVMTYTADGTRLNGVVIRTDSTTQTITIDVEIDGADAAFYTLDAALAPEVIVADEGETVIATNPGAAILIGGDNATLSTGYSSASIVLALGNGMTVLAADAEQVLIGGDGTAFLSTGGSTVTVLGADNSGTVDAGSLTALGGTGNTIHALAGATIEDSGTANALLLEASTESLTTTVLANGQDTSILATDAIITLGASASISVAGDDNQITIEGSGAYLGLLGGDGNFVVGSDATIVTLGGTSFSLSGDNNDIVMTGIGNTLALLSGTGHEVMMTESTLVAAVEVGVNVAGDGNQISLEGANTLGLMGGQNNAVTAYDSTIVATAGSSFTLDGESDVVNLLDAGVTVDVLGGTGYGIYGSDATIHLESDVSASITGDDLNITAESGASILIAGDNEEIIGSHLDIVATSKSELIVVGDYNVIDSGTYGEVKSVGDFNQILERPYSIVSHDGISNTIQDHTGKAAGIAITNHVDDTSTIFIDPGTLGVPYFDPFMNNLSNTPATYNWHGIGSQTYLMSGLNGTGFVTGVVTNYYNGMSDTLSILDGGLYSQSFSHLNGTGGLLSSTVFDYDYDVTPLSQSIYSGLDGLGFVYGGNYIPTGMPDFRLGSQTYQTAGTVGSYGISGLTVYGSTGFSSSILSPFNADIYSVTTQSNFSPTISGTFTSIQTETFSFIPFDIPLVVNLAGAQIATSSLKNANVTFDMRGNGSLQRTGWVAPGEAFLVVDTDQDGSITSSTEMVSHLSDLRAWDSNQNGRLTAAEADNSPLRVWTPGEGGQGGTIQTLAEAGISWIGLGGTKGYWQKQGNLLTERFTFRFADGRVGYGADVSFAVGADLIRNYLYQPGQGAMFIANDTGLSEAAGSLSMRGGIDAENLWFTQTGADLTITIMGTRGTVVIDDWFTTDPSARVSAIHAADGTTVTHDRVDQLTTAMAIYATAHAGFDPTRVAALPLDADLNAAFQTAWHPV